MILQSARDQWSAWLTLQHTTEAEKELAQLALDEIAIMLAELPLMPVPRLVEPQDRMPDKPR